MFGLGMGEILIILVLALVLLGPDKLPEAAKQIGKGLRDFRRATDDLRDQFEREVYAPDPKGQRPALVDPAAGGSSPGPGAAAPADSTAAAPPLAETPAVPAARADNVPGLEAALAEGAPAPLAPPGKPAPGGT